MTSVKMHTVHTQQYDALFLKVLSKVFRDYLAFKIQIHYSIQWFSIMFQVCSNSIYYMTQNTQNGLKRELRVEISQVTDRGQRLPRLRAGSRGSNPSTTPFTTLLINVQLVWTWAHTHSITCHMTRPDIHWVVHFTLLFVPSLWVWD